MSEKSSSSSSSSSSPTPSGNSARELRKNFQYFQTIPTRWMDNDVYGHVNNVQYYSFFDTVVNQYLILEGQLDIRNGPLMGLAVESGCRYWKEIAFPQTIEAGLRVGHLGKSSVRYEIGLFAQGTH